MPDLSALLHFEPMPVLIVVIDKNTNEVVEARLETLETAAALADLVTPSDNAQDKGDNPCSRKSSL